MSNETSLPRLTEKARQEIIDAIEAERAVGSRKTAAAMEILLLLHDRVHGINDQ